MLEVKNNIYSYVLSKKKNSYVVLFFKNTSTCFQTINSHTGPTFLISFKIHGA